MTTPEALIPRIKRGKAPDRAITRKNYREAALPALRRDFQDRCAYSLVHTDTSGGLLCMEVDHFDPRLKNDERQGYENLFISSRHCNRCKGNYWPSDEDIVAGISLLNPCLETEYGVHIFEDPRTNRLVAVTPAGVNQIYRLGLNASHLLAERARRSKILGEITKIKNKMAASGQDATGLSIVEERFKGVSIPPIPAPPDVHRVIPKAV